MVARVVGDNFATVLGHHKLLFHACRSGTILRSTPAFHGKDHPFFDHRRVIEAESSGENGSLPETKAYAVPVLEEIGFILIAITELLCCRPDFTDIGRRHSRLNGVDGRIQPLGNLLIGLNLVLVRFAADESAIVTGVVSVEGVHDVQEHHVAWLNNPVRESVAMGFASTPGDGIDALHPFGAEGVQPVIGYGHQFILSHARLDRPGDIFRIDIEIILHPAGHFHCHPTRHDG